MGRTKAFKKLVQHHVKADKKYAEALLREGVDAMLSDDVDTVKTILRDYIKVNVIAGRCALHVPPRTAHRRGRGLCGRFGHDFLRFHAI